MASAGKVAIVTGAGSGIGKASALALVKAGYAVVLAGRRKELLEGVAREAGAGAKTPGGADRRGRSGVDPGPLRTHQGDVRPPRRALQQRRHRRARRCRSRTCRFEQWKAVVDTNLTGSFVCTQEAFKIMKDQQPRGGRIINNGSISAHAPRPGSVAYTSTKHAITGLTKTTSLDGRKYDIACGQIDVGNAETPMTRADEEGRAAGRTAPSSPSR